MGCSLDRPCLRLTGANDLTGVRNFRNAVRVDDSRFDRGKDIANRAKHGLSLAFADRIFEDPAYVIIPSIRPWDGEERFKVVGMVDGKLHTAVFVWRDMTPRFISVRRSNDGEERSYRTLR
jgi:uncharacterized DUF497 family protein